MKEWQETSIARAKPSAEQLTTLVCRSGCECDRMQQEVELAPVALDSREHSFELARDADVARHDDRGIQGLCDGLHEGKGLFVQIGDGEFRASLPEGVCASGCNAVLVGDAGDEASLAREIDDGVHSLMSLFEGWREPRRR